MSGSIEDVRVEGLPSEGETSDLEQKMHGSYYKTETLATTGLDRSYAADLSLLMSRARKANHRDPQCTQPELSSSLRRGWYGEKKKRLS